MVSFQSAVIFTSNIARAKEFYSGFLGMGIKTDMGLNVVLSGGLALWQVSADNIVARSLGENALRSGNRFEVYFEADDLKAFAQRALAAGVSFLHAIHEESWGQKTLRLLDPDGNIVEVGETMRAFLSRLVESPMPREEILRKTGMRKEDIEKAIGRPM